MPTQRPPIDHLYPLLAAVGDPPAGGSCGRPTKEFADPETQRAVFDGEVDDPRLLAAARLVCAACPLLPDCRSYAELSLDETTFLAGQTADERAAAQGRSTTTKHRRTLVARMRSAGVGVTEISFYTGYPLRSVEADASQPAYESAP